MQAHPNLHECPPTPRRRNQHAGWGLIFRARRRSADLPLSPRGTPPVAAHPTGTLQPTPEHKPLQKGSGNSCHEGCAVENRHGSVPASGGGMGGERRQRVGVCGRARTRSTGLPYTQHADSSNLKNSQIVHVLGPARRRMVGRATARPSDLGVRNVRYWATYALTTPPRRSRIDAEGACSLCFGAEGPARTMSTGVPIHSTQNLQI